MTLNGVIAITSVQFNPNSVAFGTSYVEVMEMGSTQILSAAELNVG